MGVSPIGPWVIISAVNFFVGTCGLNLQGVRFFPTPMSYAGVLPRCGRRDPASRPKEMKMHTPKVNRQTFGLYLVALLSALVLAACGGAGVSDSGGSGAGTGGVSLTAAPACGFDAGNVTVRPVPRHPPRDAAEHGGG